MRNRAKCKVCQEILESFHRHDYVTCKCGEIGIDGGTDYFKVSAKNPENFLRIDDEDREVIPKWVEKKAEESSIPESLPSDPLEELDEFINRVEQLPDQVKYLPASQFDLLIVMNIIREIFRRR